MLDRKELAMAISKVLPCVRKDAIFGAALENILFEGESRKLTLVAANGFLLATTGLEIKDFPASGKWLLHHTEASQLKKDLRFAKEVKIGLEDGKLSFYLYFYNRAPKTVKAFSGDFPGWHHLFPKSFTTEATFPAKEMKEALNSIKLGYEDTIRLFLDFEKGEIKIKFTQRIEGLGEKEAVIKARIKGESTKQAFIPQYLRRMVNTFDRKAEVTFKTSGSINVGMFEQGETKWLIMPMFVSW